MINITKLSDKSIKYKTELSITNKSKSPLISLILAKTLTIDISLPSGEVKDISRYFLMTHKADVLSKLYNINEYFTVDIDYIVELIEKFYTWRYETAYSFEIGIIRNKETAILDFFDITDHFALDDLLPLTESTVETLYHQMNMKTLLKDLFGGEYEYENPDGTYYE